MFDFQHCLCVPFLRQMRRPLGLIQTVLRPGKNAKRVSSATIVVKVVKISFSTYSVLLIIVLIGIFSAPLCIPPPVSCVSVLLFFSV
jgi:hypothetical protein